MYAKAPESGGARHSTYVPTCSCKVVVRPVDSAPPYKCAGNAGAAAQLLSLAGTKRATLPGCVLCMPDSVISVGMSCRICTLV